LKRLPEDEANTSSENKTDRDEMIAAVRAGLDDVAAKRTKPARAALKALAKKFGIPMTLN